MRSMLREVPVGCPPPISTFLRMMLSMSFPMRFCMLADAVGKTLAGAVEKTIACSVF